MRRLRYLILGPREVGVVAVGHHLPSGRGLPVDTQIDATLILYRAAIAETIAVERGIAEGIESVEGHQRDLAATLQTQRIDSGQSAILIHCRLTIEGKAGTDITVVGAEIQEVRPLGGMLAIEYRGVGSQRSIQMGSDDVQACMDAVSMIADISSKSGVLQVVFLLQLRFRTMIARGDDSGRCTILVKGGIHRPIRQETRCRETFSNRHCSSSALQIVGSTARGMGSQGAGRAAQVLQRCQLSHRKTVIGDQPHPHRDSVFAQHQRLQSPQLFDMQVIGVIIVAPAVLIRKKRFSGILRPHESGLHLITV